MNHFVPALISSLKALVIDPEDQGGKHTMAQVRVTKKNAEIIPSFFLIKASTCCVTK
jgi:hypothetical protein